MDLHRYTDEQPWKYLYLLSANNKHVYQQLNLSDNVGMVYIRKESACKHSSYCETILKPLINCNLVCNRLPDNPVLCGTKNVFNFQKWHALLNRMTAVYLMMLLFQSGTAKTEQHGQVHKHYVLKHSTYPTQQLAERKGNLTCLRTF